MSAEHLKPSLAEGEKRLILDDWEDKAPQPVEQNGEGDQIEDAKRPDMPFIKLERERFLI